MQERHFEIAGMQATFTQSPSILTNFFYQMQEGHTGIPGMQATCIASPGNYQNPFFHFSHQPILPIKIHIEERQTFEIPLHS